MAQDRCRNEGRRLQVSCGSDAVWNVWLSATFLRHLHGSALRPCPSRPVKSACPPDFSRANSVRCLLSPVYENTAKFSTQMIRIQIRCLRGEVCQLLDDFLQHSHFIPTSCAPFSLWVTTHPNLPSCLDCIYIVRSKRLNPLLTSYTTSFKSLLCFIHQH